MGVRYSTPHWRSQSKHVVHPYRSMHPKYFVMFGVRSAWQACSIAVYRPPPPAGDETLKQLLTSVINVSILYVVM